MNQISIIFPIILKLLPNLIIIREISRLGRSLNMGLTFTFLILFCKFPELIRSFSQLLGVLISSGDYSTIYLNFFYGYQISYISGVIFTFYFVNKLSILRYFLIPFVFTNLKNFSKEFRKMFNNSYKNLTLISIFASIILMILIITFSSSGLDWIFNSRMAYMRGRSGIGPLYVLYIFAVSMSSFYFAFSMKNAQGYKYNLKNYFNIIIAAFILFLSYLSGSKGVIFNIIATQFCFYLLTKQKFDFKLIIKNLFQNFKLNKIVIYALILFILIVALIIYLLRGYSLISYLSEVSLSYDHLLYTLKNPESIGFPGSLYFSDMLKILPRQIRNIFGLPSYSSVTTIMERIYNTQDYDLYKINTPSLDPVLATVNKWGSSYYIFGAFLSSTISTLPIAYLVYLYKKTDISKYYNNPMILIFAVSLNYLPLINRLVLINFLTFIP